MEADGEIDVLGGGPQRIPMGIDERLLAEGLGLTPEQDALVSRLRAALDLRHRCVEIPEWCCHDRQ